MGEWRVMQNLNTACHNGSYRAHVGNLVMLVLVEFKEAQWVITSFFQHSSQQDTKQN